MELKIFCEQENTKHAVHKGQFCGTLLLIFYKNDLPPGINTLLKLQYLLMTLVSIFCSMPNTVLYKKYSFAWHKYMISASELALNLNITCKVIVKCITLKEQRKAYLNFLI